MTDLKSGGSVPIDIGSQLELMVDDYLIDSMSGGARLKPHRPTMREVAIVADEPWEGNAGLYWNVLRDGDLYRAYYGGMHYDPHTKKFAMPHAGVLCYAESQDGVHWTKPALGLWASTPSILFNISTRISLL